MKTLLRSLCGLLTCIGLQAAQSGIFIYTESGGKITITGHSDSVEGTLTIPSTIAGKPVAAIGSHAFEGQINCGGLKLPDSVTSIGDDAFAWSPVGTISFGKGLTRIGSRAFSGHSLETIKIPNSVTSIGDFAFSSGYYLTSVNIPASVTHIGAGAFAYCNKLAYFMVDPLNQAYCDVDSVGFDKAKTRLITYPGARGPFYQIPATVDTIEDHAFAGNALLKEIAIGPNVTRILGGAFAGCLSLTNLNVSPLNRNYTNVGGIIFDSSINTVVAYPSARFGPYTVPEGVTAIGDGAFQGAYRLRNFALPEGLTRIGNLAFGGCNLGRVIIPASVTEIGADAFEGNLSLTRIYFAGNAPSPDNGVGLVFGRTIVYHREGTTGWGPTFSYCPTQVWSPVIQTDAPSLKTSPDGFTFQVRGASNIPIVIETITNLNNPAWVLFRSDNLTNGLLTVTDKAGSNTQGRLYRVRFP
jgi:hypothetical protein